MSEIIAGTPAKSRYSIDLDESHRTSLAQIAKTYRITQGEAIEVLIDNMGNELPTVAAAMAKKREDKVARRAPKKELYQQLKGMSSEQIATALAAAQALQVNAEGDEA